MKILPAVFVPIVAVLTMACSDASGTSGPTGHTSLPSNQSTTGSLPSADGAEQPPADVLEPVIVDATARAGVQPSDQSTTGSLPSADGAEQPPADVLEPVIVDAAARAGVQPSEVVVVSATAAEWSDGSLGCPQPGMLYTQAQVSGYQVILRAAGQDLDYRVQGPDQFKLCEKP